MNIIHGDLTTENLLLDGQVLKIGDFGQSWMFQNGYVSDQAGIICALQARSPEMIERKYVGRQTDTWALGVILYYMCTYDYPFGDPFEYPGMDM